MIQFITTYGPLALTVFLSLHATALIIVNATPTPKDDAILSSVYKFIETLAGFVTSKSKQTGGE